MFLKFKDFMVSGRGFHEALKGSFTAIPPQRLHLSINTLVFLFAASYSHLPRQNIWNFIQKDLKKYNPSSRFLYFNYQNSLRTWKKSTKRIISSMIILEVKLKMTRKMRRNLLFYCFFLPKAIIHFNLVKHDMINDMNMKTQELQRRRTLIKFV